MAKASDLRRGHAVNIDGQVFMVVDTEHVAKGNKRSYMQVKIRNIKTGQLLEQRYRVSDDLEDAFLEKKEMEYLYSDASGHVLMDLQTYDQMTVNSEAMGEGIKYLKPNTPVQITVCDGQVVGLELPNTVELRVVDTPPVLKGSTATNQSKDAVLETGARVKVPPFIEPGGIIRVDTRSGEYIERVK